MLRRDQYGFKDLPTEEWVEYRSDFLGRWVKIYPGSVCEVQPCSKAKNTAKVRGRKCQVIWIGSHHVEGICGIRYLDTGRYGERYPHDLVPLPTTPVNLNDYRDNRVQSDADTNLSDHT